MKHLFLHHHGDRRSASLIACFAAMSLFCCATAPAASVPPLSDIANPLPGAPAFGPNNVVVNKTAHRIYAVGSASSYQGQGRVSIINTDTNRVVAGLVFPWPVDAIAVNESKNLVYVGSATGPDVNSTTPTVFVIDGATDQVKTSVTGAFIGDRYRAACDPVTGDILSNHNNQAEIDVNSGTTLAHITAIVMPNYVDGFVLNPTSRKAYVQVRDSYPNPDKLEVVDLDSDTIAGELTPAAFDTMVADPVANKVFLVGRVTANNAQHVHIQVLDSGATIDLPDSDGVPIGFSGNGVAVDSSAHRLYVATNTPAGDEIVAIDTNTSSVVSRLSVSAQSMAVFDGTGNLYLAGSTSGGGSALLFGDSIAATDPNTGSSKLIVTGYRPNAFAYNATTDIVYVSDADAPEILAFKGSDHSLVARISVPPIGGQNQMDDSPPSIAVSSKLNRVYRVRLTASDINTGNRSLMLDVIDGSTNKLLTSLPVTADSNLRAKIALDDSLNQLYVGGYGQLFVLKEDDYSTVTTITGLNDASNFPVTAGGLAVNPVTHRVYMDGGSGFGGHNIYVVDGSTNTLVTTLDGGAVPGQPAVNTKTNKIFVPNTGAGSVDNSVTVIDGATDSVETTIQNITSNKGQGDAVTSVAVDEATNTIYVGDNGDQAGGPTSVNVFDGNNGYSFVGKTIVNQYPTGPIFAVFFDPSAHQVWAAEVDDGVIYVLGKTPLGPIPAKPADGGLSDTVFAVNGLKSAANITSPFLSFTALQTGTPSGLNVRVQVSTTPGDPNSWTYLDNGTGGFMFYDVANDDFALVSTNYPLTNGVYFRAIASAGAYPDSISNVVGPFNLTSNLASPGQTTLVLNTNGIKADFDFKATETGGPSGPELHVQSSTDPSTPSSWADVQDGNNGLMTQQSDPTKYRLLTNNIPSGTGIYFRVRASASGALDSFSNILGPYSLTADTPPAVTIVSPDNGNGVGQDIDHPVVLKLSSSAPGQMFIRATAQTARKVQALTILLDGSPIAEFKDGTTDGGVMQIFGVNNIGVHMLEAVAIDDLGAIGRGATGAVFIRIDPPAKSSSKAERIAGTTSAAADSAGGTVFTFIKDGGNWTDPTSWSTADGSSGVPGSNDVAIVGSLQVTLDLALGDPIHVGSLVLNGGALRCYRDNDEIGLAIEKTLTVSAGSFHNINLNINTGAVGNFINDADVSFTNGVDQRLTLLFNAGTLHVHGRGGIIGLKNFVNQGTSDFQFPYIPVTNGADTAPDDRIIDTNSYDNTGLLQSSGIPGASLVKNLSDLSAAQIVAQGAGNIVSTNSGNIVAQGAGNIVAQGAGNFISHNGSAIVAQGAGNIVAQGAGNLTAQGGMHIVAQGAGNIYPSRMKAASISGFTQSSGETKLDRILITGPVNLDGGVLSGSGIVDGDLTVNGGYVSPGSSGAAGVFAVTGNYTQTSQGTLILEDGGATPDKFDQLFVGKTAMLDGKLDVKTINSYQPGVADTFNPLSYGNVSGSFAAVSSDAQVTLNATGMLTSVDTSKPQPKSGQPLNISTRMEVLSGDDVLIAGFIVSGPPGSTKKVMIRGLGPSLANAGVANPLADPLLELHEADGSVITNDDWQQGDTTQIPTGFSPASPKESVIIATLSVGAQGYSNYTAVLRGANGETGVGLAEAYDLDQTSPAKFANISTRGYVDTGDNVMIGGFIVGGSEPAKMLVRAIGPSLGDQGVSGALQTTALELHDANGDVIGNQGWRSTQESEIVASTIPPNNDQDSAIVETLVPGNYTAVVRGVNNTTGVGLVEAYNLQ